MLDSIHLSTVQPLDFLNIHPLFEKTVLEKFILLKEKHEKSEISLKDMIRNIKNPSLLRAELFFLLVDMKFARIGKQERIEMADFLHNMLKEAYDEDIYGLKSNIVKNKDEIKRLVENIEWKKSTPQIARLLGKIYSSGYTCACSNYTDLHMYYGVDNEGPYDVSEHFDDGFMLIIKKLTNLKPVEIWPNTKNFQHNDATIFYVYKNIKYKSDLISSHTKYKGDIINNLVYYSVYVDGNHISFARQLSSLKKDLENLSANQWKILSALSEEELKVKAQEIRLYCLKEIFEKSGIDWKPNDEMKSFMRRPLFPKEKWNIPKNKELEAEYWKQLLKPEIDFFPGDKLN